MNNTMPASLPVARTEPLIVILDDEPSILSSLRSLLHRCPYRMHFFTQSGEALEFIMQQTPDLVISDMRMPDMNGTEFLTRVHRLCPATTRLLLSGYEDKKIIIDAIARGVAQMYILKPWEDDEILGILRSALAGREELRAKNLEDYIHAITSLPSSPALRAQVKLVFSRSERSIKEVASQVEKDPGLVAQLMHVANSVFFGARNPIANIQEAITFIGLEYVEGLILGTELFKHRTTGGDASTTKAIEDLWHHAMNRAFVGRAIASHWEEYSLPQPAYIACLLLDIGFVVRLQMNPEEFLSLTRLARELGTSLHRAEQRLFEVDHTEIGAALLRFWNFPGEIVAAISAHHSESTRDPLTRLVQMADVIEAADFTRLHDVTLNPTIVLLQKEIYVGNSSSKT
jgi:HD-like signal output (HDOD) protein